MNIKINSTLFSISLLALLAVGCKPTEKNYQAAYEKAHQAAERKAQEQLQGTDGRVLEVMDGPRVQTIEGEPVYVATHRVKPMESVDPSPGNTGVAVACFSMPTNARRLLEEMKGEYPDAFIATNGDDRYYIVIGRAHSNQDAMPLIRAFREANPDYAYFGLGGHPILLPLVYPAEKKR